jgi:CBS domain-containing protein
VTKVEDIMIKEVITFSPDDLVYDAAKMLREKKISGAPVVEDERVIGILSETDLMKLIESHDIDVNTILPSPFDVLELPVRMKLGLDKISDTMKKVASAKVKDIMSKDVVDISKDEDISKAARIMAKGNINRLPVVDDHRLVGIITRGDVIGAI